MTGVKLPVISVLKAREIMGKDADGMTDDEIQELLNQLNSLARIFVDMVLKFE